MKEYGGNGILTLGDESNLNYEKWRGSSSESRGKERPLLAIAVVFYV